MSAKQIWNTLSAIDVSNHVEKKANLSYLSWAWAWGTLMKHYPDARYTFDDRTFPDGTMEITCSITIFSDDCNPTSRYMWLPVMDNRNKAIANPDAFQINTAKMRCLTKCLAMFGLGHYIYAGEDLPEAEQEKQAAPISLGALTELTALVTATATDREKLLAFYKVEFLSDMTAAQGEKAIITLKLKKAKLAPLVAEYLGNTETVA